MREYSKIRTSEDILEKVICNKCGKSLKIEDGIVKEGWFHADYPFDYFSRKDGYIHSFDLCEECFDAVIKEFKYPVEIREMKEFI